MLPKVMIVDDDPTTVMLLQMLLELDGFEVSVAERGSEVLGRVRDVKPDLILMDYHLVDMDGLDVLRDLRRQAEFARLPIIMTSGMNVEQEALQAGATQFLLKPFEPDDLPVIFNKLIGAK